MNNMKNTSKRQQFSKKSKGNGNAIEKAFDDDERNGNAKKRCLRKPVAGSDHPPTKAITMSTDNNADSSKKKEEEALIGRYKMNIVFHKWAAKHTRQMKKKKST